MAKGSSGFVAGLTVAAVAVVGFLAFQASANVPDTLGRSATSKSPSAVKSKAPRDKKNPVALPADSGKGERVVYSIDDDRVWLVGANNKVQRTFKVTPGTVDPLPATYAVTSRSNAVSGSDGTPIEHVVRFASNEGVTIGFSAAVDGSTPAPVPTKKLGGIRESRADGDAMWEFATISQKVVVIN
ncbi:hypothetical protein AQJ43_22890 [Streptomyces avermitilis]|uniref:Secreted protein n=3 Tax=Streptomyces TaxID=1883 RepID=Q82DK5_STRAW|nr:hypothetical protein [Streptomyces avermitilis]MYT00556.1 hypothetical protein [Streptomyces sp. SID5469]KUN52343.1 hypothetical protein AQJ43_22890 [Streptomyces avermitilis]OOV30239.1 hypothetical protein SM007_13185 [Streptomyces avermitilis]BAC72683.1 putative secreted protein [Streptomyces avermitilis MA-4680 = NBRC 14893]BBJ53057.1 hypothetical protein SAVMC3_56860 [Streptomyces avermitilis]